MLIEATEAVDEPKAAVAVEVENPLAKAVPKPRAKATKKAEEAVPEAKKTRKVKGKVEFAIVDEK